MMKKTVILLSFVIGLIATKNVEAQMAAAGKIVWDVEINVDVKTSKGAVWRLINDNEQLQKHSNGYVKSVKTIDEELVVSKEIIFANGKKRTETIAQTDYVNKFMVIQINKSSLPKGIKNAEIAIFTKDIDDDNSNILWVAKIEGKKSSKQKLMDQLKAEFESYAIGFGKIKS
jgi:carbon monoxide dehydrogenase subunit G